MKQIILTLIFIAGFFVGADAQTTRKARPQRQNTNIERKRISTEERCIHKRERRRHHRRHERRTAVQMNMQQNLQTWMYKEAGISA